MKTDREEIIRMARDAGIKASVGRTDKEGNYHPDVNALSRSVPVEWLERFAALVAAAEREACAKVCEDMWGDGGDANDFAQAVRARGNA